MSLHFRTEFGEITAVFESQGDVRTERVIAKGKTLTEAVENLARRFAELQNMALEEMYECGVVRTERTEQPEGPMS